MTAIRYEKDQENIVLLTMDMPGQSANTMNAEFRKAFRDTLQRLQQDKEHIAGVIITSAKKTFFAGGDLRELIQVNKEHAQDFLDMLTTSITQPLRQLELLGRPVVAAINGTALGGGWELALACHARIALADDRIELGLPEVTLGLLPGGGGVARLPRYLGLEKALPLLLEGKKLSPPKALSMGLLHELAENPEDLINAARAWIKANPSPQQPWDTKGYKIPGGSPSSPKVAQMLAIAPAMLKAKTKGCYPAPEAIMSAAVEGAQVDFETAQKIESRYFTYLTTSQVAKNMIGTFWFQLNDLKAGQSRPKDIPTQKMSKVGVLGAGMMGSGIAYACAQRGLQVVLKDVEQASAEKGKAYSDKILAKKVSQGRMTEPQKQEVLDRITPTTNVSLMEGCDLIIEAVFENSELKAKVTQESEPMLRPEGIFASNTSTIPITQLAQASRNSEKFVGLHFFSPVDKMQLVEIIVGESTSQETLAKAFDFVMQIGKVPIVVNDSRGFFTSRVFGAFVNEGVAMLAEGIHPAAIENAAQLAGMPVGPLALSDEVSLTLMTHIRDQSRKDVEASGGKWSPHPAEQIIDAMVSKFKRKGKADGAGFYEYPPKGAKHLWPQLVEKYTDMTKTQNSELQELKDRLLFIQSLETMRCLEENVLRSVKDANIGSIFGLGFAPWTGGAIQYANQYGLRQFVERANYLHDRHGERFAPPALLVSQAEKGAVFE
ncbi:3-hydroxyacyl-CoA dehydrogenase NAD-binding domain-containing protein [Hahella aquimaris]|uniref:3-hydroxyacyl-CoA dehydrogenase NAD-binding domain-containing protein n=1 Tax=Hahella sp. HNIBRBA332 TaxID=3015983 RepID=UPI00273C85BF|nr:3-hydroxyacyl-CoA dehydrogenase NAD-binding domain-containing protein [Hahella sp. HNIBRBA332]WLQ11265.1 3-hydroxyacyl-CoA dehydrogenase NAD-binding domain-containing protein [Hahella sp. HNIBRBA332]